MSLRYLLKTTGGHFDPPSLLRVNTYHHELVLNKNEQSLSYFFSIFVILKTNPYDLTEK